MSISKAQQRYILKLLCDTIFFENDWESSTFQSLCIEMDVIVDEHRWIAQKHGQGEDVLLAFHGYGQDNTWFEHVAELLGDKYTILAFDLAYHGNQKNFEHGFIFDKEYAQKWLKQISSDLKKEKLGFIGYSIGARIALSMASWSKERVSEIYLLAPDGMPVSKTYKLLTGTWVGVSLFRGFIKHPGIAFGLINLGKSTKLLNPKVALFFKNEIATIENRQQLFDTWMAYRKALPDYKTLKNCLKENRLPITCILGKQDRVIPWKKTRSFAISHLPGIELIELDLGHNLLSDKSMRLLTEYWQ
jgi:pimeloyl-ACP methyl ester carboxylesterase